MRFRFKDIVEILVGEWSCFINGQQLDISNEEELTKYRNYLVVSVNAQNNCLNLELKPWETPAVKDCSNEDWYKEHINQFGTEPGFF